MEARRQVYLHTEIGTKHLHSPSLFDRLKLDGHSSFFRRKKNGQGYYQGRLPLTQSSVVYKIVQVHNPFHQFFFKKNGQGYYQGRLPLTQSSVVYKMVQVHNPFHQQDLCFTKDEVLQMLIRLKYMIDSKLQLIRRLKHIYGCDIARKRKVGEVETNILETNSGTLSLFQLNNAMAKEG